MNSSNYFSKKTLKDMYPFQRNPDMKEFQNRGSFQDPDKLLF